MGQGTALDRVTSAIKRSRAGVSLGSKPIGSFIFVGATGVCMCIYREKEGRRGRF